MAHISRRTLFNRTLLVGSLGLGAALGLTRTVHHKVATPPPPPPAALVAALHRQQNLLAGYDAVRTGGPALPALRADVVAHGQALAALLELYPGWRLHPQAAPASSAAVPSDVAGLAAASKTTASSLAAASTHWSTSDEHAAEVIAMLGSIAACLDTHVLVLS